MTHFPLDLCIPHILEAQARRTPHAIAITAPNRLPLTYAALHQQLHEALGTLHTLGFGRDDRLVLLLPPGPEMAVAFLTVAAGATCAPLNPASRADECARYLHEVDAAAVLVQSGLESPGRSVAQERGLPVIELVPWFEAAAGRFTLRGAPLLRPTERGPVQPDDIALILPTSGTTSRPKMVPLTQRNLCTSAQNIAHTLELTGQDRCLNIMPLFHIHGLIGALLSSLVAGASVVCTPGFAAAAFFTWLDTCEPTWYTAVPSMHQAILVQAMGHRELLRHRPLRFIRSSSAALPTQVLAELERVFAAPVIESYGMTEASHQMASNPLPPRQRKIGAVGIAAGPEVAIMDATGQLLAPGTRGEVVIRGANVTSGYLKHPTANQEAFTHGWFRTGDEGFLDADGYVFLTGRLKEMINRGGETIAPQEVDAVLLDHPAVAQAITFAVPHPSLGEDVAAAVVLRDSTMATAQAIRAFAWTRLAAHKVPSRIAIVDAIPHSPTGKLQRVGLAEHFAAHFQTDFIAPGTVAEEILAAIWSDVLQTEHIGSNDNFFALGGDSLLATQVVARVEETLAVDLSIPEVFLLPTLAEQAQVLADRLGQRIDPTEPQAGTSQALARSIPRRADQQAFPLSFAQERLWFLEQFEPGNSAYNRPLALRLLGTLDTTALAQTLHEILRRHEVLRVTFSSVQGRPVQRLHPAASLPLEHVDLQSFSPSERAQHQQRLLEAEMQRPLDLTLGPLVRATLFHLEHDEWLLLLSLHHIVFDAWSARVFIQDLAQLYDAALTGRPALLPALPMQYADYADWQRQRLQGHQLDRQLAYWHTRLADAPPVLELPTDKVRPPIRTLQGAQHTLVLPQPLIEQLQALSQQAGATLFMTLLAAFQTLLYRYTGQEDIVVGAPIAGRTQVATEHLIGCFINTLVLRTDLSGNPAFLALLARVRETCLGAYEHQELPFEKLVESLNPARDLSRTPLFQVLFNFEQLPGQELEVEELRLTACELPGNAALCDLALEIFPNGSAWVCCFTYSTDLFESGTIERLAGHFITLLEGIVGQPDTPLSTLPLLTTAERQQLLVEWNATRVDYLQDVCVHELFEAQAARTPEAVAVVYGEQQLSYRELNERANQLAHYLRSLGVGPETLVGLCLNRSLELVMGILGILKAGGAYLPLDAEYPPQRLQFMLTDAKAKCLVTQQALLNQLPSTDCQVLYLDSHTGSIQDQPRDNSQSGVGSDNLVYVMYTSGSTGVPKGTLVGHAALANHMAWLLSTFMFTAADNVLQKTPVSFDASVWEFFTPLLCGARLTLAAPGAHRVPADLVQTISKEHITVLQGVPTLLRALADEPEFPHLDSLRLVFSGGEELTAKDQHQLYTRLPQAQLVNLYGPTETCIDALSWQCDITWQESRVPIGHPIANTQVYVLNQHRQPVPIGVPGELYIGGAGLARGYLNRPELTAERFVAHPFSNDPNARLYRTGDLCHWQADGNLAFLGRIDDQVKLRGYRIELGEIESVLNAHPDVAQSIVTLREDRLGGKRLVAYCVPMADTALHVAALSSHLRDSLPDYMVPAAFVALERLPLTPSGKIDRRALPAPDDTRLALATGYVAPRTPIERHLVSIWGAVLGLADIGIHDNFFTLGGHSLLAIQLLNSLGQGDSGATLSLRTLFDHPTIAGLAQVIEQDSPLLYRMGEDAPAPTLDTLLTEIEHMSEAEVERFFQSES